MATMALQAGYGQDRSGLGRLQRIVQQPLLIGLVAAGGAGIYGWSALTGQGDGLDQFAPVKLPAAPRTALIPEVKFQAAPAIAASPAGGASATPARLVAARPIPVFRPAKPAPAAAAAVIPAAPRTARSPSPDYSYVSRVVLPAPPPVPAMPARTVRVELPPPAPVALAPAPRRVTGSFAAPALQPLDPAGIEPVPALLAPAQPLMTSVQPVAVGAAPLQLAPAQPALTGEPLGAQAAPLVTPPAAATPLGASPSPLVTEPQPAPQFAPSAPALQPLQTPPGAIAPDATALSAAGFHMLDDAQLSGIKSISGPGKQSGRAALQAEPAVAPAAKPDESAQAKLPDKVIGSAVDLRVPVVGGAANGELPVRIGANGKASVRLGELLALVAERMERGAFAALSSSPATSSYVGFDALRAAGIDIAYAPARNEVRLSARNA